MSKDYSGKEGTLIQITTEKIRNENSNNDSIEKRKRRLKDEAQFGRLSSSELKMISIGLDALSRTISQGIGFLDSAIFSGGNNTDVTKIGYNLTNYGRVIETFLFRLSINADAVARIESEMEDLEKKYQILQAARDGILLKQNNENDGATYDTSMSTREVYDILNRYEREKERFYEEKFYNYLGIGLSIASTIGSMILNNQNKENTQKSDKVSSAVITLGTLIPTAITLFSARSSQGRGGNSKKRKIGKIDQLDELGHERFMLTSELIDMEQVSNEALRDTINSIINIGQKEKAIKKDINNLELAKRVLMHLFEAILTGIYVKHNVQYTENGKIKGSSLVTAISNIRNIKSLVGLLIRTLNTISDNKRKNEEFYNLCARMMDILEQIDEKVIPIKGASQPFNSFSINNLTGRFYPKTNYQTGEKVYSTIIKIPEFSIKRGEVVLLSGDSGSGKSTFLRFLKRGDIDNVGNIILDNGEVVDSLGEEVVSFKPSLNLGNETNVLFQITGKKSFSKLNNKEKSRLIALLKNLNFDSADIVKQLETKKFMEFSTGEQKRLALSKLFYRIDDAKSVIIVDEPVGNVENSLIREQLEMITQYAKKRNLMLILTTHRVDLAEDLVTKRYHINDQRVMKQVQMKKRDLGQELE